MLRFIILSLFLVEAVILAPNSNFVVLPATDACADCSFVNNSPSPTVVISDQSQPIATQIRKTNYENTDSETLTRVRRCVGEGCEFQNSLERLKNELVKRLCTEEKNELTAKVTQLENDVNNHVKKTESLEGKINNSVLQLRQKNNEIGKLNNQLQTVQNENSRLESVEKQLTNKNKELNDVVAKKDNSIEKLNTELETLQSSAESEIKKLQNNVTDLNDKVLSCDSDREENKINESIAEIEGKLKLALNDKAKLEKEIEFCKNEIKEMEVSIVNIDQEIEGNKRLRDRLQEANKKHIFKIVEYEEIMKVSKNNNSTVLEGDLEIYKELISLERNPIKENEQKINKINGENDQLEKEKENLQSIIEKESQKVKNLENSLETLKSEINNSNLTIELLVKNREDLVKEIVEFKSESKKLKEIVQATEFNLQTALEMNHNFDKENIDLRNLNKRYESTILFLETQLAERSKGKD